MWLNRMNLNVWIRKTKTKKPQIILVLYEDWTVDINVISYILMFPRVQWKTKYCTAHSVKSLKLLILYNLNGMNFFFRDSNFKTQYLEVWVDNFEFWNTPVLSNISVFNHYDLYVYAPVHRCVFHIYIYVYNRTPHIILCICLKYKKTNIKKERKKLLKSHC